jgi:hypothetical protein
VSKHFLIEVTYIFTYIIGEYPRKEMIFGMYLNGGKFLFNSQLVDLINSQMDDILVVGVRV